MPAKILLSSTDAVEILAQKLVLAVWEGIEIETDPKCVQENLSSCELFYLFLLEAVLLSKFSSTTVFNLCSTFSMQGFCRKMIVLANQTKENDFSFIGVLQWQRVYV